MSNTVAVAGHVKRLRDLARELEAEADDFEREMWGPVEQAVVELKDGIKAIGELAARLARVRARAEQAHVVAINDALISLGEAAAILEQAARGG